MTFWRSEQFVDRLQSLCTIMFFCLCSNLSEGLPLFNLLSFCQFQQLLFRCTSFILFLCNMNSLNPSSESDCCVLLRNAPGQGSFLGANPLRQDFNFCCNHKCSLSKTTKDDSPAEGTHSNYSEFLPWLHPFFFFLAHSQCPFFIITCKWIPMNLVMKTGL